MMNLKTGPVLGTGAAMVVLAVAATLGTSPLQAVLAAVIAAVCGAIAVTLAAQRSRFEARERLVYRPVYVRTRSVHVRVSRYES